jgi:cytochrome c553
MNPAFLKTVDDKLLKKIIEEGRAGTQMTSWKSAAAGLTEEETDSIIQHLVKTRPTDKPATFGFMQFKADVKHGEDVYKMRCWFCHGPKGEGELGLNLRNPVVQGYDPEFIAITVRDGRKDTPMPSFGKNGVKLGDQDIVDVVSFVKTLAQRK